MFKFKADSSSPLQHLLFGSLGRSLACADPPESERLTILNEAWKVVTKVRSPQVLWGQCCSLTGVFFPLKQVMTVHAILCFRITSTVLRSGWSSPAGTLQWVNHSKEKVPWHLLMCAIHNDSFLLSFLPSLVLRNVRSTPSWLTSSNTWLLTGRLRTLIHRLAAQPVPLQLKHSSSSSSSPLLYSGSNLCFSLHPAAVSDQEDPHLLSRLLRPLRHGEQLRWNIEGLK